MDRYRKGWEHLSKEVCQRSVEEGEEYEEITVQVLEQGHTFLYPPHLERELVRGLVRSFVTLQACTCGWGGGDDLDAEIVTRLRHLLMRHRVFEKYEPVMEAEHSD